MLMLQAPWPTPQTTTLLPDPEFNDSDSPRLSMDIKRSMNGTKRVYIKSDLRRKRNLVFRLSRMKALELRAFINSYYSARIKITDTDGTAWSGYLTVNPFEFEASERANGYPGRELLTITLEFEGMPL